MLVARALTNSQLIDGENHAIYGTGHQRYEVSPDMTLIPAKVIALEKPGDQYQVIVQISSGLAFQIR